MARGEINYTDRNGQQYHISAEMEKDISIYSWNFYITGSSQFYIYKDEELVLRLISNTEKNRPVWLPLLIRGNSFTGELLYRDYVVTLDYKQLHTHERSVVLSYGKTDKESPLLVMNTTLTDDADILKLIKHDVTVEADFTVSAIDGLFVFSGHSNNVNYLVVDGMKIAKYMKNVSNWWQISTTNWRCRFCSRPRLWAISSWAPSAILLPAAIIPPSW